MRELTCLLADAGLPCESARVRHQQQQITEAVAVHFDEGTAPRRIRIHYVSDPILVQACYLARGVSGIEAIKALERLDFLITRQTGLQCAAHRGPGRVTVPMHRELVLAHYRASFAKQA